MAPPRQLISIDVNVTKTPCGEAIRPCGSESCGNVTWVDWEVAGWVEQADWGVVSSGAEASLEEGWNAAR